MKTLRPALLLIQTRPDSEQRMLAVLVRQCLLLMRRNTFSMKVTMKHVVLMANSSFLKCKTALSILNREAINLT